MHKEIAIWIIAISSVVMAVSSVIAVSKISTCDPMTIIAKWEEAKAALNEQPDNAKPPLMDTNGIVHKSVPKLNPSAGWD